jgi:integrase
LNEAKTWRRLIQVKAREGLLAGAGEAMPTVAEAADALAAGMADGSIRNRKGEPYKPACVRGYRRALKRRIVPALGQKRLSAVRRADVQALIDGMAAEGLDGSTIRNAIDPLRVIYRRAVRREIVAVSPCDNLELPAPRGVRDRIASPSEAAALIAALTPEDRALWATALYAGLRRGELRGLRWGDVDLHAGIIRVERGWDYHAGEIEAKSRAGRRTVPITGALRRHLVEHRLASGGDTGAFVFPGKTAAPFEPSTANRRAEAAWKAAGLDRITMHEARHTFASLMIAAGVNAKMLSTYMGHASVTITFDRYGHLMPGNEAEAARLLDEYLDRATADGRAAV